MLYAKALKNKHNSLLKFLPILSCFWTEIILHFIISLSINNSYNPILIIVNDLIKKTLYIIYHK